MTENENEGAPQTETQSPASSGPVFGSAATFTGSGFGGFALSAAAAGEEGGGAASSSGGARDADAEGDGVDPEAECQAEFKPLVTLEEVDTKYVCLSLSLSLSLSLHLSTPFSIRRGLRQAKEGRGADTHTY